MTRTRKPNPSSDTAYYHDRTMVEAENEAVFRRFYEGAWNAGDLSVVDELLSEDFLNHE